MALRAIKKPTVKTKDSIRGDIPFTESTRTKPLDKFLHTDNKKTVNRLKGPLNTGHDCWKLRSIRLEVVWTDNLKHVLGIDLVP